MHSPRGQCLTPSDPPGQSVETVSARTSASGPPRGLVPRMPPGCLDGWLPASALLHPHIDGSVVVPLYAYTVGACVTGLRTAVRFGLPLMSGTPGAGLAREGVVPAA